jgi:thioredoxin 1
MRLNSLNLFLKEELISISLLKLYLLSFMGNEKDFFESVGEFILKMWWILPIIFVLGGVYFVYASSQHPIKRCPDLSSGDDWNCIKKYAETIDDCNELDRQQHDIDYAFCNGFIASLEKDIDICFQIEPRYTLSLDYIKTDWSGECCKNIYNLDKSLSIKCLNKWAKYKEGDVLDLTLRTETSTTIPGDGNIQVIGNGKPTMIDFYADWCRYCRIMEPVIRDLKIEYRNEMNFVRVDMDKDGDLVKKYGVRATPTYMFFDKKGKRDVTIRGAVNKSDLESTIKRLI